MLMLSSFPRRIVGRAYLTRSDARHNDDHSTRRVRGESIGRRYWRYLGMSRRGERSHGAQTNTKVSWWFVAEACILRAQRESRKDRDGERAHPPERGGPVFRRGPPRHSQADFCPGPT